ncbi:Cu-processing system permease protein [Robiginitalea myxolifaciens]|uniref:Cu-processing system permease protein n=1 Tax=Robiginitalea myxolifaciens TaxID=400055 RepID=A0A1I6FYM6_9FLAO|nr:ABC transporter permease [Robiginitalea myxolifaciens]SFR34937.1 Cu-processing system permease protein [Robiginitalea myxolifaciens]
MLKILKYSFYDLLRSRWAYAYFLFYLILGFVLLFLNGDLSKAVITLMNLIIILVPLISTIFGVMYFYSSREFTELLLAQPVRRDAIFLGQYLGITGTLASGLLLGLGIPFVAYGLFQSNEIYDFITLIVSGLALTFIFTGLAFNIAVRNENRIRGFGYAVLLWLFMAVVYDGLFLLTLIIFEEYPLDHFSLSATVFNPIDLSRILILLKLDISALLGYTGAVFKNFLGTKSGIFISCLALLSWIVIPLWTFMRKSRKKDF